MSLIRVLTVMRRLLFLQKYTNVFIVELMYKTSVATYLKKTLVVPLKTLQTKLANIGE